MRTGILMGAAVAIAAAVGLVAQQRPESPRHVVAERRPDSMGDLFDADEPATTAEDEALRGRVREVIDVAEYTYLRLATAQGDVWAAVSKASVALDTDVAVENPTRMEHFESATLKRTFEVIYFGTLQASGAARADVLPPGHPSIDGPASTLHAPGAVGLPSAAAAPLDVKVPRAVGGNARTIGELFAAGAKLEGQLVRVRGQIVKVTPGVMGKTYLRLRDGSEARPEERELVVTSQAEAQVGTVATFEGTLRTQVDVGIGFIYPVLLGDAQLVPEPAARSL